MENLTGQTFGKWTVIGPADGDKYNHTRWYCRCECGTERKVLQYGLKSGRSLSCGCDSARNNKGAPRTLLVELGIRAPEYRAWANMHQRCGNPNLPRYKDYGGRGIRVCEAWRDFNTFYKDMGPRPSDSLSVHRIDNDGNYEPSNCKWATRTEQHSNMRHSKREGSISGIARTHQVNESALRKRIGQGMSIEDAIKDMRERPPTIAQLAHEYGMSRQLLFNRLFKQGLSMEEALNKPKGKWTHKSERQ